MKKFLVGLSGGVDSAVAAYLLKKQGYDVVAGFMKNYVSDSGNCSTYQDAEEAIKVAKFLGIEILYFDLIQEYNEKIIKYIYDGYKKGITPNPDVFCNNLIKFDVFLNKALELGFDGIATGHYARIVKIKQGNNPVIAGQAVTMKLFRGVDYNKDQSYFLSGLNQFQLSKSVFPIGDIDKPQVRKIAKEIGLPNAERKDSQGLCFVGNIPIKTFLEKKLPHKKGDIINIDGKKIGEHDGAWFYTIGQRRGLNLLPDLYVSKIDIKKNIIYVGPRGSELLNQKIIYAKDWHRIADEFKLPMTIQAKIRYRQEPKEAILEISGNNKDIKQKKIEFKEKQWAIAPGQIVVAYDGDECLGNGVIIN
ncbi:MAG: tRNA 2-thiouridine(34) synthase MnmA [Candidatus Absconditicoccaceae bacterium]